MHYLKTEIFHCRIAWVLLLLLGSQPVHAMQKYSNDLKDSYRPEPYHSVANRPYCIKKNCYKPDTTIKSYRAKGVASWYGRPFHGRKTSNGEYYNMFSYTAASTSLPIPSYAKVTNLANKKSIIVRINDRGPFIDNRILDLSFGAAHKLGFTDQGLANVHVEWINPALIAQHKNAKEKSISLKRPKTYLSSNKNESIPPLKPPILKAVPLKKIQPPPLRPNIQLSSHSKNFPHRGIQVAYFKQSKLANQFINKFRAKHPTLAVKIHPLSQGYQIIIGPLSEAEAPVTLRQLKKEYHGAFLVTSNS